MCAPMFTHTSLDSHIWSKIDQRSIFSCRTRAAADRKGISILYSWESEGERLVFTIQQQFQGLSIAASIEEYTEVGSSTKTKRKVSHRLLLQKSHCWSFTDAREETRNVVCSQDSLSRKILDFTQKSRVTEHILDVMSTITNTRFVWTIGNATSVNKQSTKWTPEKCWCLKLPVCY